MVEAQDAISDGANKEKSTLAKIEPSKIEATSTEAKSLDMEDVPVDSSIELENSLISATIRLLREYGVRKSGAAVRDAVDISHQYIGPKEAVSSLSRLGFKASFGRLNIANIAEEFFPLIAFKKNGEASVILEAPVDGRILTTNPVSQKKEQISIKDYNSEFSQYAIIAKALNDREKKERTGHWFFSAFRKSKWIYVQVMIAAMVSNFLSLTTALFTMTVYDRVIPNGAFESLIALSIGVVIALGFDFLIKSLRASFIDTASKRADLEISRRLFERILTLSPTEQRQKNWCYGWYDS
jgi:ATP-binding cassette subfamily C protein LapB